MVMEIKISDDPDFKGEVRISREDFRADPKKYIQQVKDGYQVFLVDGDKVLMVLGTGRTKIEVIDPEMDALQEEIMAQSADEDITRGFHSWLD